jgi:hypothetical protein
MVHICQKSAKMVVSTFVQIVIISTPNMNEYSWMRFVNVVEPLGWDLWMWSNLLDEICECGPTSWMRVVNVVQPLGWDLWMWSNLLEPSNLGCLQHIQLLTIVVKSYSKVFFSFVFESTYSLHGRCIPQAKKPPPRPSLTGIHMQTFHHSR